MMYSKRVTVDFETDEKGRPFKVGDSDTPTKLPQNITVKGFRRGTSNTNNHLVIFDTKNPTGGDNDLQSDTEKHVLIINEDDDKSDPDDNRKGGSFIFGFRKPIHQFNKMVFLDMGDSP